MKELKLKLNKAELTSKTYKWEQEKYTLKFNNMKNIIKNQKIDMEEQRMINTDLNEKNNHLELKLNQFDF